MASAATEGDIAAPVEAPTGASSFRIGDLVAGKYRLEARLGAGAMGEVWRARHEDLNTDVAIKFARAQSGDADVDRMLERFRFEAQVSAQLSAGSRHIVAIHDVGTHHHFSYAVMELMSEGTLDARIFARGALEPGEVVEILEQIAEALAFAHARGIWHRDLKPANILLGRGEDGRLVAKLADFGVAKVLSEKLDVELPRTTQEGVLVGSPCYMSPEQISGKAPSGSSDVWSLAVVAYEALGGTMPFNSDSFSDLLIAISARPHAPIAERIELGPELDEFFARALAKDPLARFDGPREMATALRAAIEGCAHSAPRPRWLWAVAAAVTIGAVAYAAVTLSSVSGKSAARSDSTASASAVASARTTSEPSVAVTTPALPVDGASAASASTSSVKVQISASPTVRTPQVRGTSTPAPSASARYDKSDTF
jgi:serine/threonine-protein kinase